MTSIRKTMDYGQTKCSQVLPGTTYLGLYRATIKGLNSGKIWLVDESQKSAGDYNIYNNTGD